MYSNFFACFNLASFLYSFSKYRSNIFLWVRIVSKYIDTIKYKDIIIYSLLKQQLFIFGIGKYSDSNIEYTLKYRFIKYLYINKNLGSQYNKLMLM